MSDDDDIEVYRRPPGATLPQTRRRVRGPDWLRKIDAPCREECIRVLNPDDENFDPEWIPTVADAIVWSVTHGATHEHAARWAGTTGNTLNTWLNRGARALAEMAIEDTQEPPEEEQPYVALALDIMGADADHRMAATAWWNSHFRRDWRSIEKFMAKRYGGIWADQPTAIELSGPGGGPIELGQGILSVDAAETLTAQLAARAAQQARQNALEAAEAPATPNDPPEAPEAPSDDPGGSGDQ